jgi:hypothetical protein
MRGDGRRQIHGKRSTKTVLDVRPNARVPVGVIDGAGIRRRRAGRRWPPSLWGGELADAMPRVGGHAEQHFAEVVERRHPNERAALDQRVQQSGTVRALEAPRKQPVLATAMPRS